MRILVSLSALLLAPSAPAIAHVGHVAEVAGHSHWIGLAAALGAAALGAWIAGSKKKEEAEDCPEDTEEQPA
ncbi:MAG: DUF6732 family protein [Pseudomonadota bacterium]